MKRIMFATDFSERSDQALRRVVILARAHDAVLQIVHVVDDDRPRRIVDHEVNDGGKAGLARGKVDPGAREGVCIPGSLNTAPVVLMRMAFHVENHRQACQMQAYQCLLLSGTAVQRPPLNPALRS
jgi:nucleotide-binding universal stress UspA family protein